MVYVSIFIFIIFIESIIYKHENSARDLFENQEFQRSFDHISYMHDCINTVGLDHVIAKMRSIFSWLSNGLIKCVGFNKHNLVYTIKGSIIYRCISNWSFLVYFIYGHNSRIGFIPYYTWWSLLTISLLCMCINNFSIYMYTCAWCFLQVYLKFKKSENRYWPSTTKGQTKS